MEIDERFAEFEHIVHFSDCHCEAVSEWIMVHE